MTVVKYITIEENDAGQRIDNFLLRELKRVPRSMIYRILRKGEVRVNKKRIKPTYRLDINDIVRVPPVKLPSITEPVLPSKEKLAWLEEQVLHEDANMIVINKPVNMAVHGGSGIACGLIEALRSLRNNPKLELVHRLDRGTSGCLMIAKKRSALRYLHEIIREHKVEKKYQAIVAGKWQKSCNKIDAPLKKNTLQSGERMVKVDPEGKESVTTFKIIKNYQDITLIEATLKTGRTHQIRVHTQYAGHSIIGDDKYTDTKLNQKFATKYGLKRLCLHAAHLSFIPYGETDKLTIISPIDWNLPNA